MHRILRHSVVLLVVASAMDTALSRNIFWTDNDRKWIGSANLDGSNPHILLNVGETLDGLAVDSLHGKIYWVENVNKRIGRSNIDGSNMEYILSSSNHMSTLDLDLNDGKLYWAGYGICRANLDGTAAETVLSQSQAPARDIALDLTRGKIYWGGGTSRIGRANMDGSGAEILSSDPAYALALDSEGRRLFVADWFGNKLYSVDEKGEDRRELAVGQVLGPRDVTLYDGWVYWTQDHIQNKVLRCRPDGTQIETVIDLGTGRGPTALVIVPEPATLSLLALGAMEVLRHRRTRKA